MDIAFFKRILTASLIALALLFIAVSCDNSDDNQQAAAPWEPTDDMLNDGPGGDAEFVHWSQHGHQIIEDSGSSVTGWCYLGDTTHLQIPGLVGLFTFPNSFSVDSIQCTIDIADHDYAQLEYEPDGLQFDAPIELWLDTSVVELPTGLVAADVAFYYYNRDSGDFEELETILDEDWWIVYTNHFSRYILGRRVSAN